MFRVVVSFILCVFLFSCASTKEEVKEVRPVDKEAERQVILPEVQELPRVEKKQKVAKRKPPPVIIEKGAEDKYVILNFDDADVRTVIETMGDLLSINYILSPGVSGSVTIQSYKKFPVRDLFSIFQSILEMNGLTAIRKKEFYVIMPIEEAKQQPVGVSKGKQVVLTLDSSFISQIIPLEYVKASDAANLLRGLMPRGTDLVVYEPTNLMIVTARPEGLVKFMKILDAIDIPSSERENIRTFVYYVENGEAKKLAEILKTIYGEKKGKKTTTPRTRRPTPRKPGTKPAAPTVVGGSAGVIEGEITITAYEDINALIIKSSPAAYLTILEIIKKLDIPPKQVLIEVLIAEVRLTDREDLGLEWFLKTQGEPSVLAGYTPSGLDITTVPGVAPTTDYFAYIIDPNKFVALLNFFASYGRLNIISSPVILALDNKEAKIEVGDDIPIATGVNTTTTADVGTTALVSAGQIQYRTAGSIITVTPHISDKDKVTLKIEQELSRKGEDTIISGQEFPSFLTRRTQTTGIVQDKHTLIIGGLISESHDVSKGGFPILSQIPILGYLFGTTSTETVKNELIVMVTPHVIRTQEEADVVTKEFQTKVRTITERFDQYEIFQGGDLEQFETEREKTREK